MENLRYKESWRRCKCGSRIIFDANSSAKVPELCKKCQEIADMKQTTIGEWDGKQKKIEYFGSDE